MSFRIFAFLTLSFLLASPIFGQRTAKIMHYNLLQYGNACSGVSLDDKDVWLKNILTAYQPDIFTVNEMSNNIAFANRIKVKSIPNSSEMQFGDLTNNAGGSLVNMIFYNENIFGYGGVKIISGSLRDINVYTLYDKASATSAGSDTVFLHCIVAHFKAGSGTNDQNQRQNASNAIMNWVAANAADDNYLLLGDLNLNNSNESSWQTLINNSNSNINFKDPINQPNGWTGQNFAAIHTQSTRSSSPDCGSGGGMDDRFDFILASDAVMDGTKGVAYVPNSYTALGNDGASYNTELDCSDNQPVSNSVCASLKQMSDHLPIVMEVTLTTPPVSIDPEALMGLDVSVRSHSTQGELSIYIKNQDGSPKDLVFGISDMLGNQFIEYREAITNSTSQISLPVSRLAKGLYVLKISDGSGLGFSQKFVVGE